MNNRIKSSISVKMTCTLSLIILSIFLCIAGCMQIPSPKDDTSDITTQSIVHPEKTSQPAFTSAPLPTAATNPVPDQSFPPNMPPQIREQLIRQGKLPSSAKETKPNNLPPTSTPIPTPTSYVTRLSDSISEDTFIPSRSSIYFTNPSSNERPVDLHPVYSASGIPLNTTIKELEVHAEKGPFSVRFTVHPKGTPLVSWARIAVIDPFQNILYEDGFNRQFSSESVKEFEVYYNGSFLIQIAGEAATLDISINTPDGSGNTPESETKNAQNYPPNMPPQLREKLMREGRL
ncbi:MAG: hypothetical protein BWY45_00105 [Euryarchaeota archaeon ADurb.Bin294]|nr:MAG: hypothetical protein BWY45_00105 [Euryarchaeota archaeon ADurb.Bin294]